MSTPDCPTCAYGWLDTNGTYHDVEDAGHDNFMDSIDISVCWAEENGWIHLAEGNYQHYGKGLCSRLTPEQRRWLVKVGFELHKGDEE